MLGLCLGLQNGRPRKTIVNLLGISGNLGVDANGDSIADILQESAYSLFNMKNFALENGEQYAEADTTSGRHYINVRSSSDTSIFTVGDTLYFGCWTKTTKGTCRAYLYNKKFDGLYDTSMMSGTKNSGQYELLSTELTISSVHTIPNYMLRIMLANESGTLEYVGAGENITFKKCYFINLTQAGKTKEEMDAIIQSNGYFESISI